MSSFGLAAGPAYALWYRFLEKAVVRYYSKPTLSTPTAAASTSTSTKWKIAITKVIADFSIFDIPYLSVFFLSTNMASGYSFEDSFKRLRRDLLPTFGVEVATWTPIQLLNFRFVKVPYQPIVVNGVNGT